MIQDVLIVDDEADIRDLISDILHDENYSTRHASNSDEAFNALSERTPSLIILDIWLNNSELDGLGILEVIKRKYSNIPVIMISGHGTIETAISSLKIGAFDFIEKPFKQEKLIHVTKHALEVSNLKQENQILKQQSKSPDILVGTSSIIAKLRTEIEKISQTNSRIFINGQIGTGKEIIARIIHDKSSRKHKNYAAINASQITGDNIETTLFGKENSGDLNSKSNIVGLLEQLNGGTLFIDEIANISKSAQTKLLNFLQNNKFKRISSDKEIEVNVRIISASSENIDDLISQNIILPEFYHRLNVETLEAPSLNDRYEDMPSLSTVLFTNIAHSLQVRELKFNNKTIEILQNHNWTGNLRQLKNLIEWLLITYSHQNITEINSNMLPAEFLETTKSSKTNFSNDIENMLDLPLREAREIFERNYLLAQIERFEGNISRASNIIGMERSALHRKIRNLSLNEPEKLAS